jgi:serine/threonine protein kinase
MLDEGERAKPGGPAMTQPQTTLGEYILLKEIGSGSYARVFKASGTQDGKVVALKVLLTSKLDERMKQNLANECLS